jgi:hypothetical protein
MDNADNSVKEFPFKEEEVDSLSLHRPNGSCVNLTVPKEKSSHVLDTIGRLPNEVLGIIFAYARDSDGRNKDSVTGQWEHLQWMSTLEQVCARWNTVVRTYSDLYTVLDMNAATDPSPLELFLARSRNRPFSAHISGLMPLTNIRKKEPGNAESSTNWMDNNAEPSEKHLPTNHISQTLPLVLSRIDRITELHLRHIPTRVLYDLGNEFKRPAPMLRILEIYDTEIPVSPALLFSGVGPSLQHLTLSKTMGSDSLHFLGSLRSVEKLNLDIDSHLVGRIASMLSHMSELRSLVLSTHSSINVSAHQTRRPLALSRLDQLELRSSTPMSAFLLDSLHLPMVKSIIVDVTGGNGDVSHVEALSMSLFHLWIHSRPVLFSFESVRADESLMVARSELIDSQTTLYIRNQTGFSANNFWMNCVVPIMLRGMVPSAISSLALAGYSLSELDSEEDANLGRRWASAIKSLTALETLILETPVTSVAPFMQGIGALVCLPMLRMLRMGGDNTHWQTVVRWLEGRKRRDFSLANITIFRQKPSEEVLVRVRDAVKNVILDD